MLTLSVIGVEDGALLAAGPAGERFRIPVDAALRARLREDPITPAARRLSPKEVQAHVRAGLSAQQVAALAGASVADVERFVGPVLAERAYVLETALAVKVRTEEGADPRRFASVMDDRFGALDASSVAWTSLKEAGGPWIVAVRFSADGLQHDARWSFDLKRQTLAPENVEAATLSQQGAPLGLTPRLKAVPEPGPAVEPAVEPPTGGDGVDEADVPTEPPPARFDSAVFRLPDLTPATADAVGPESTSDLLDALAAKRGAREPRTGPVPLPRPASDVEDADDTAGDAATPDTRDGRDRPVAGQVTRGRFPERLPAEEPTAVPDTTRRRTRAPRRVPSPGPAAGESTTAPRTGPVAVPPAEPPTTRPRRTGRTSMPSWDEIVFGRDED